MMQTRRQLTDPPVGEPLDLVGDVLARLRLAGPIFLRAEFTAPWAYESPPSEDVYDWGADTRDCQGLEVTSGPERAAEAERVHPVQGRYG
jgi:hypothetical protein